MTPVPTDAHPATAQAKALGCTCDNPANFGGQGHVENVAHIGPVKREFMQRYWIVDRACKVHGDLPTRRGGT